jgi:hypothetical protein
MIASANGLGMCVGRAIPSASFIRPSGHQQSRGVENIIAHPMLFETAVQPEPVVTGLVARDHLDWSAQIPLNLLV